MKQHKWHKEIKAWADGAEIEMWYGDRWEHVYHAPDWQNEDLEYRIKSQPKEEDWVMICKKCGDELGIVYEPKEPQYLYVYQDLEWSDRTYKLCRKKGNGFGQYVGKIKLEDTE